jgi:hypothetical protein
MRSEVILINTSNGLFETLFGFLYKMQFLLNQRVNEFGKNGQL